MSFLNLALTKDFISVLSDGQITENEQAIRTHFKKFYVSPNGFLVGITGFHKISEEILVQLHYQPQLMPLEAQEFLLSALLRYKDKRYGLTKKLPTMLLLPSLTMDSHKQEPIIWKKESSRRWTILVQV